MKMSVAIRELVRVATVIFVGQCFIFSCTSGQESTNQHSSDSLGSNSEIISTITSEQETALDALNEIQLEIAGKSVYSTFPGIQHDCFPADTSFVIERAELLIVIKELLTKYGGDIAIERLNKLASNAVLAQEEYLVEQCFGTSMQMVNGVFLSVQSRTPSTGIWILPNVLGRRDIILIW